MSTPEEIVQMIEDVMARDHKLSEWEVEFIDSVDTQLRRGQTLTEKQDARLTQIWERVT